MTLAGRGVIALGLVLTLVGAAPAAIDPAFDFTGHWAGFYSEDAGPQQSLSGDLSTQSGTRRFTGSLDVAGATPPTCTVTGAQKRHKMRVKMHVTCGGAGLTLHATLDTTSGTPTLTGGYRRQGRHKTHVGMFTLTKTS